MKRSRGQPGFTLLELLIALAMVSMLALSIYSSLRVAFRARDSARSAVAPVRAAQVAMEMLKQNLESALPPPPLQSADAAAQETEAVTLVGPFIGEHNPEGRGSADALEFYCIVNSLDDSEPTMAGGVQRVTLSLVGSGSADRVLVRRTNSNLLAPQLTADEEEILCRGVRSLAFRYWDGQMWQDTWDSSLVESMLPMAVEVTLELQWPPGDTSDEAVYRTTRIIPLAMYAEPEVQEEETTQ